MQRWGKVAGRDPLSRTRRLGVSRRVLRGFSGDALRALREDRGLTRQDLARKARVGLTTLYHWESGVSTPTVDILARVVGALGASIEDVVAVPVEERYPADWRILRGLTQPELGKRTGLSTSLVGAIERGEVELTASAAKQLAAGLEIPAKMLFEAHERARTREPGTPA